MSASGAAPNLPSGRARLAARLAAKPAGYAFSFGRVLVIYVALTLAVFLASLDQAIVATAGAVMIADLGGVSGYAWIFTGYLLASTVTIPLWGKLGDVLGKKRPLALSIGLFLIGSALCAIATSMPELIVFRIVQGIGAGGLLPLSHATVGSIVPLRERGRFVGLFMAAFAIGSVGGPLVGGLLVDTLGWRSIFLVNIPIGLVALVVVQRAMVVPAETRSISTIDWTGAALLAVTASLVLYVLSNAGQAAGWASASVVAALAVAIPFAALLTVHERRVREPILPFSLLRKRSVTASVFSIGASGAIMFLVIAELPFYMQTVSGESATRAGLALIPMLIAMSVGGFVSGRITTRFGRTRPIAVVGTFIAMVGLVILAFLPDDPTTWEAARGSVLAGLGIAAANQVYLVTVQSAVAQRSIGAATALAHFGRAMGAALGVTLVGVLLARAVPEGTELVRHGLGTVHVAGTLRDDLADALRLGFGIGAGVELVAFLAVLFLLDEVKWRPSAETTQDGYSSAAVAARPPA